MVALRDVAQPIRFSARSLMDYFANFSPIACMFSGYCVHVLRLLSETACLGHPKRPARSRSARWRGLFWQARSIQALARQGLKNASSRAFRIDTEAVYLLPQTMRIELVGPVAAPSFPLLKTQHGGYAAKWPDPLDSGTFVRPPPPQGLQPPIKGMCVAEVPNQIRT
jgi:hypothetical protein